MSSVIFEQFGGLGLSSRSYSIYQPASITQQPILPRFQYLLFFEKVNNGHLKMTNVNYKKWPDFAMLSF